MMATAAGASILLSNRSGKAKRKGKADCCQPLS